MKKVGMVRKESGKAGTNEINWTLPILKKVRIDQNYELVEMTKKSHHDCMKKCTQCLLVQFLWALGCD